MGLVSTVQQTLLDVFSSTLTQGRRPLYLLVSIGVAGFLLGLSMTTRVRTGGVLITGNTGAGPQYDSGGKDRRCTGSRQYRGWASV